MYDTIFDTLVENWKKLDVSTSSLERFVQWFMTYKSPVLKSSMLKPVRQRCGLGSPPVAFTTNASESVIPHFLDPLKALIDEQDHEIQKAIVNRGKYALQSEYKKFKKSEDEWFLKMNKTDRVHHLQRFASCKLTSVHVLCGEQKEECPSMSIDFQGDDMESNQNLESHSSPMSPQRSVSNDIPGTSYASSFSHEDPPSTKRLRRQLFVHSPASPMFPQMPAANDITGTSAALGITLKILHPPNL